MLAASLAVGFTTPIRAESGVVVQKVKIADGIYQFITRPTGTSPTETRS